MDVVWARGKEGGERMRVNTIKTLQRVALLSVFCTLTVSAQYSQTIFANSAGISGGNFTWVDGGSTTVSIPNIGQSVHTFQVRAVATVPSSGLCTSWFTAQLQGAWDGAHFVPIPGVTQVADVINPLDGAGSVFRVQSATGAYPFLRLRMLSGDFTNCTYTANYAGILATFVPPGAVLNYSAPSVSTGSQFVHTTAAGNTTLSDQSPAKLGIAVYGVTICNATAGQTVTIKDENGNIYLEAENIAAGACIVQPMTATQLFTTVRNQSSTLIATLANATPVDVTVFINTE